MNFSNEIVIEAPAAVVWDVFSDVEKWSEWTASVTAIEALDGSGLAVGKRFAIKQPRLPRAVWKVDALDVGRGWTWTYKTPGNTTSAVHVVTDLGNGTTRVRQEIHQGGVLGALIGALLTKTTKRYLDMEAAGLKARSEDASRRAAQA